MKSKLFSLLLVTALGFTACSDSDNNVTPQPTDTNVLKGSITASLTLMAGTITLDGPTIVREGATLTIPAGTKIIAKNNSSYILIEKGAKIVAKGTANKPITFTSEEQASGAWGGLIINGKAPISHAQGSPASFGTEINDQIQYGGHDIADNSGELDYIILEYTGANISDDKEHNGLTLNAVGNATKISNIYIKDGADDAIEFFGGSVNVTNLLVVDSEDDMFDFTQGYTGTLQNAYGIWTSSFTTDEVDPRAVEADGNHDGKGEDHINQSNFIMQDITIVHNSISANMGDILKIRRNATATINNLLVQVANNSQFGDIIDLSGTGKQGGNAATVINYTFNPDAMFDIAKVQSNGSTVNKNTSSTGANTSVFTWTKYAF